MSQDPELRAHQEWLGFLQPSGLVVSPAALRDAQAYVNKNIFREQEILKQLAGWGVADPPRILSFPNLGSQFFGWELGDLAGAPGGPELPKALEVPLPDYSEVLAPTYAVPDPANQGSWLMLVKVVPSGASLDELPAEQDHRWHASPQSRFERLLRENQIPIGLLCNGDSIRLAYAPRGESAGHLTFPVQEMCEVAGRPITAALHLLLSADRLFSLPANQRLPAILQQSRKYQNEVSTKLAEQVLRALNELMRGFQAANEASRGELLREVLRDAPSDVYGGLLTTLMRLVFVLYAEDRGLVSTDPVYLNSYSISGLFERLREDASLYPDTMDQRYGAWAQIITLSRLIYDGGGHGTLHLPPRHGRLFDPDAYSFLEGRRFRTSRSVTESLTPPRVSDGVMFRVLQDLMVLDGDRLSYRSLDVEQLGSVYEAMMGFEVRTASGPSIGLRPDHVVFNLQDVLEQRAGDRNKWIKEQAGCELSGKALEQLKQAASADDLMAALDRRRSPLTPSVIPSGAIYLQPTEERRRSGSHYTPRSLTEPIVRTTLQPILVALGEKPRPEQILDLKVCDPAMGSGAFLVEACRYLGDALVEAWTVHGGMPVIPPDQEPVLHARRLIAQRCLYGVDKNLFAVDLAKLSLWLATLAKDHAFTFLDHSLREGDSLVGLTRRQIAAFNWVPDATAFPVQFLEKRIRLATEFRQRILAAADDVPYTQLLQNLNSADDALSLPREVGDAAVSVFFSGANAAARERERKAMRVRVEEILRGAVTESLPAAPAGMVPFHWELEFPEVFSGDTGGFNAIVGNPPFAGKNTLIAGHVPGYVDWLKAIHEQSHGNSDLVAHFFRRAFTLLCPHGRFGLIATNTIGQGDTRSTGLRWICTHGGTIYQARKRLKWPGQVSVVVSVVHLAKESVDGPYILDGREVPIITAYLCYSGGHEDPAILKANRGKSFQGSTVLGAGFMFQDAGPEHGATSLAEMERLITINSRNKERIFRFVGGEELNDNPVTASPRYVINFADFPLRRVDLGRPWADANEDEIGAWLRSGLVPLDYPHPVAADFPDLLRIVEEKVKGTRASHSTAPWWQFERLRGEMYAAIRTLRRALAVSRVRATGFAFVPPDIIASEQLIVFAFENHAPFCILQSRVHDTWSRFFSGTALDLIRYTKTDCFETFPFPDEFASNLSLEEAGRACYAFRYQLMQREDAGLTTIYNRFDDPDVQGSDLLRLRELHDVMDRAVLDAYGWDDIRPHCEFIPEFEDDEDDDETGRPRRKKYRYRWPDDIRDDVLARLLELNRQRAELETLTGAAAESAKPKKRAPKAASKLKLTGPTLFTAEDESK